eukprot:146497-Karenia_brevis.AAC.1
MTVGATEATAGEGAWLQGIECGVPGAGLSCRCGSKSRKCIAALRLSALATNRCTSIGLDSKACTSRERWQERWASGYV